MPKRKTLLQPVARSITTMLLLSWSAHNLPAQQPIHLIAHRGGVVNCHHPEDSPGAAKAAIRRGYWMLEVDLQSTKDGHIVVHHDDFQKSFGILKMADEMTWDQIRHLRATEDHSHPMDLAQLAALCKGKIQLMVDVKPPNHPKTFYHEIEETLRQSGLLKNAYFIGLAESRAYFKGKALIGMSPGDLRRKIAAGEPVTGTYFLFVHGTQLNRDDVALSQKAGAPLVVTINDDHYAGRDHMLAAHADIMRARALGVQYFQIDSDYDIWLQEPPHN